MGGFVSLGSGSLLVSSFLLSSQRSKSCARCAFQAREQGFQLVVLPDGGLVDRTGGRSQLDIDRFGLRLVGPFPVRTVTFGGIHVAGTGGLATLHGANQDRSLTKILQALQFLAELPEASLMAVGKSGISRCAHKVLAECPIPTVLLP